MSDVAVKTTLTDRTALEISAVLAGHGRGPWRNALLFAGPAVIASIAYMDPGNFATNIQAGSKYGYSLLWVVLLANALAMLFQSLSAKLGIVTGRNLAQLCRTRFPAPLVWTMWGISEIAAMATDLAEFLGGAIGLSLLFGLPLLAGMLITGVVTYGLLSLDAGTDHRRLHHHYRHQLPGRDADRPGGLGGGGGGQRVAEAAGCRGADHSRRHHRRHGDAARDLPALRPHPEPRDGAK